MEVQRDFDARVPEKDCRELSRICEEIYDEPTTPYPANRTTMRRNR
jgi:hypothetical protein